jgi:hypothetical protein
MLRLHVQAFYLPKAGNQPEEYEDAWACDEEAKRLAIADGASDAFESRLWAKALVQAFIREPPTSDSESMLRWLESPIQVWKEGIHWDELPWYAVEKARRGAFSTLLGVTLAWPTSNSTEGALSSGHWSAVAVGDTCLFQIRGDEVIVRFPMERAADFGTTPPLLSTRQDYNRRSLDELRSCEGECWPGDLLVLATDALAEWFLHQLETGEQPWQRLVKLSPRKFARLVECLRREEAVRNDDVSLLLGWVEEEVTICPRPSLGRRRATIARRFRILKTALTIWI